MFKRSAFVTLLCAAIAFFNAASPKAQDAASEELLWKNFISWLGTAPSADNAPVIFKSYLLRQLETGASEAEAARRLAVIQRIHRERPDAWRAMFNRVYTADKPGAPVARYSVQPNASLVSAVEGRTPGTALDIGVGQGRNAVFLAYKGWDVTGFDVSDEAINATTRNAEAAGVKVKAVRSPEAEFNYGESIWDLVVFMYEPFPITSEAYSQKVKRSLKSGGLIVIEGFAGEATDPKRQASAIDPTDLLSAFKDFRVKYFQELVTTPDWGRSNPNTRVVRLVAEKK